MNNKIARVKIPKSKKVLRNSRAQLPLYVEKDEDGFYVVECPLFEGCYTQGKNIDQALKNIREVIELVLEDKANRNILNSYRPLEISLHTITI
jgi:predicted RNase H-like HicB family nuclease